MVDLEMKRIYFSLRDRKLLQDISLFVRAGEFVGIIGPNGSGKSTLLKQIYRKLKPDSGEIVFFNTLLETMKITESAKKMAVVNQFNQTGLDFTVEEMVMMGRIPHQKNLQLCSERDNDIVCGALKKVGMENLKAAPFNVLSGGEKQRVILARALAQCPGLLILDEPTNHLDIKYQLQLLNLIAGLKIGILGVLHDLNLACMYCNRIYVLKDGCIFKAGPPEKIITEALIKDVYDVDCHVSYNERMHCPIVIYDRGKG